MNYSERIRQLREEKGLSPSQLAAYLNKSEGAIRGWEKERTSPDVQTVLKMATYFDVTTDYLLGASDIRKQETKYPIGIEYMINKLAEKLLALNQKSILCLEYYPIFLTHIFTEFDKAVKQCEWISDNLELFRDRDKKIAVEKLLRFFKGGDPNAKKSKP